MPIPTQTFSLFHSSPLIAFKGLASSRRSRPRHKAGGRRPTWAERSRPRPGMLVGRDGEAAEARAGFATGVPLFSSRKEAAIPNFSKLGNFSKLSHTYGASARQPGNSAEPVSAFLLLLSPLRRVLVQNGLRRFQRSPPRRKLRSFRPCSFKQPLCLFYLQ